MENTLSIDLLAPRYEVVNDWPMNVAFTVGEIIINPLWHYFALGHKEWHMKDLPHLFRKLQWWEKRTVEEMPEYVKDNYEQYWRVEEWEIILNGEGIAATLYKGNFCNANKLTPSTIDEYHLYLKSKP